MKFHVLAAALVAAIAIATCSLIASRSEAAPQTLSYSQACSGGALSVTFSWPAPPSGLSQQWLDISLQDNGWQAGTFLGNGPLSAAAQNVTWSGLLPGSTHYMRLNQRLASGAWDTSPTFYFTTDSCPAADGTANTVMTPPCCKQMVPDPSLKLSPAPIESAQVVAGGDPGHFVVKAKVGLPSGCAKAGGSDVQVQGAVIQVNIYDTFPNPPIPCTSPLPSYDVTVDLGALTPHTAYEIHVNDKVLSFAIP